MLTIKLTILAAFFWAFIFNTCWAQNVDDAVNKCAAENTEFAKTYCYFSAAKAAKNKSVCDNIKFLPDRYICYIDLAVVNEDVRTCYEIPSSVANAKMDLKSLCYKKLLQNSCNKIPNSFDRCNSQHANKTTIERLCRCGVIKDIDDEMFSGVIRKCDNVYSVNYPDILDLGTVFIDDTGKTVGSCGGMPLPSGEQKRSEYCDLSCEKHDLCKGTVIDCKDLFKNRRILPSYPSAEEELAYYQQKLCDIYFGRTEKWYQSMFDQCEDLNSSRK